MNYQLLSKNDNRDEGEIVCK